MSDCVNTYLQIYFNIPKVTGAQKGLWVLDVCILYIQLIYQIKAQSENNYYS